MVKEDDKVKQIWTNWRRIIGCLCRTIVLVLDRNSRYTATNLRKYCIWPGPHSEVPRILGVLIILTALFSYML